MKNPIAKLMQTKEIKKLRRKVEKFVNKMKDKHYKQGRFVIKEVKF